MKYTVTLKGTIPKMQFDGILAKYFSDGGYGYQKIEIEAENEAELSIELDLIRKGTDLKIIGINY